MSEKMMSKLNSPTSAFVSLVAIKDNTSSVLTSNELQTNAEVKVVPLEVTKKPVPFARIQSPSSINTYKQCPRKYYYQYIEKLPTKPSIHMTRGSIAHSVLERFFELDITKIPEENAIFVLKVFINDVFKQEWEKQKDELAQLDLDQTLLDYYFYETREMLNKWYQHFIHNLAGEMQNYPFVTAFQRLTPKTEEEYASMRHGVKGFIDAVFKTDEGAVVLDYKTSKNRHITDAYKLQLALYALLYQEKHGSPPKKAGIFFLKHGALDMFEITDDTLRLAVIECELIHMNTQSIHQDDYPKKPGPLCKWKTGQCDFYEKCFGVSKF